MSLEKKSNPEKSFEDLSSDDELTLAEGEVIEQEEIQDESSAEEEVSPASVFEAILFLSADPLPISFFVKSFSISETDARIILASLMDEYEERDGGVKIIDVANGYQFVTNPRCAKGIRRVMGLKKKEPLTKGMLETLAIVAYKQPVVMAELEELRGVSSRMMVANLMKRNLIKPVGRKDLPGRPLAYGTTDEFLRFFGLNKLTDLPKLSEIKEFNYENEG
jgi:segregation and condensation protein B